MIRLALAFALLVPGLPTLATGIGHAQEVQALGIHAQEAQAPRSHAQEAQAQAAHATADASDALSLAFLRAPLFDRPADRSSAAARGIEDATTGVWVGAAVGAVVGGLLGSWAFCGLGEGDCGFSITAAGPGVVIGGLLGASVGGLLDRGPVRPDVYDDSYVGELRAYKADLPPVDPELRERADELIESDTFLGAVGGSSAAAVVVDPALRVVAWNRVAEDLWGLPPAVADDTSIGDLPLGVVVEDLQDDVFAVARGESEALERDVEAVDGNGRPIDARMRIVPFFQKGFRSAVIVLIDPQTRT